jgi:PEP-CTERM motif
MKALARRVKGGFSVGIGVCVMIAMTCSMALGNSTPDNFISVPEPGSYLMLVSGLGLMILFVWLRKKRPGHS